MSDQPSAHGLAWKVGDVRVTVVVENQTDHIPVELSSPMQLPTQWRRTSGWCPTTRTTQDGSG